MFRVRLTSRCLFLVIVAACAFAAPAAHAECGFPRVSISGSEQQRSEACNALREVLGYFEGIGLVAGPIFTLEFRDQVFVDVWDFDNPTKRDKVQVSGVFDAGSRSITVTSSASPFREGRKPWKLSWGPEIAASIIRHELTHAVVSQLLEKKTNRLSRTWKEFIAYAVQIDLMPAELRERVFAVNPDVQPFPYPETVNAMIYGMDPDRFGLSAFLFTQARGGRAFIRRLLVGDVEFTTDDFLWTK